MMADEDSIDIPSTGELTGLAESTETDILAYVDSLRTESIHAALGDLEEFARASKQTEQARVDAARALRELNATLRVAWEEAGFDIGEMPDDEVRALQRLADRSGDAEAAEFANRLRSLSEVVAELEASIETLQRPD